MRGLGLLLVVAACNPPGLTLEVVIDDPNISKVELFAGDQCYEDCPRGTVAPGLPPMSVDAGFIVYDPEPFTAEKADFSDGVAGFRIESTQETVLGILVAVAYNAQNEVVASATFHYVAIPTNGAEHWRVELMPTTVISATIAPQPPGTERIKQWHDSTGLPACMLLEHWNDSGQPIRELVAPDGDLDCDGVAAAKECAPWVPNAMGIAPTLGAAACVMPVSTSGATICMVGGPQCTETPTGPSDQCVPLDEPYCAPSAICQCSGSTNASACIKQLIIQATTDMATMPFLKCVIHVDAAGNRCDNGPLKIDGTAYVTGGARSCKEMRFHDSDAPLGQFGNALHLGEAKLKIESLSQPCTADLYWAAGMAPQVGYGVLDTELDNGYHLVVPARVDVKPGCIDPAPSMCGLIVPINPGETMFKCAESTIDAKCAADLQHGCAGPYCNGMCCGSGESCGPNGCQCGTSFGCTGTDKCQYRLINADQCGELCCGPDNPCPF